MKKRVDVPIGEDIYGRAKSEAKRQGISVEDFIANSIARELDDALSSEEAELAYKIYVDAKTRGQLHEEKDIFAALTKK